jgi:formylglycine-generating enzyme required for sulfatase activity
MDLKPGTLKPGTRVTDRVVLTEPIGEGAMGAVWKAEHRTLHTQVAVKFISEESIALRSDLADRFSLEASAAAQIKSPHVVQMIDHGLMDDGMPYIVMELLQGESLEERIEERGPLSLEQTAEIITQVAKALEAAHTIGVIHRDIKPHNIFLTEMHGETFAKVLDFGIAKQIHVASGKEITEPGMIVGTPQYVSRDLVMGNTQEIDRHVDLWSLSVVAYKCLTKALPFDGDSIGAICAALATAVFRPPSEEQRALPRRVDGWFRRAFAENREDRFATATELAASFRSLVEGEELGGGPASTATVVVPRQRRRKLMAVGAISVAVVAALAVSVASIQGASDETPPLQTVVSSVAPSISASAPPPASVSASATALPDDSAQPVEDLPAGPGEVAIPAGEVHMGCTDEDDQCADDEKPKRVVFVDAFLIDRTEVPVLEYAECVMAGVCSERRLRGFSIDGGPFTQAKACNWKGHRREHHPINCINYHQAKAYCEWRGARLPTEAEWERAARGDDERIFPWGDEPATCVHAVMAEEGDEGCGRDGTWPVAKRSKDKSPFGVVDMAGNVREWVDDWYDAEYYLTGRRRNPPGPNRGVRRVTRGGSWGNPSARFLRTSVRDSYDPATRSIHLGFRCARSAQEPDAGAAE